MYRRCRKIAASLLLLGFAVSCSSYDRFPIASFSTRLQDGDRHLGWSLNYFNSWRRERQPQYLLLAEDHTVNAIDAFSQLESDTSPRINEYYVAGSVELADVDYWRNYNLKPSITVRPSVG